MGYDDGYYARPRAAKGGIKAQSQRGAFGASWWAKRWIEALEAFGMGARLSRGRTYARKGQVIAIDVSKGSIKARVQGSRPRPYEVQIRVATLSAEHWRTVAGAIASQALFSAKLLSGELPHEIEGVFEAAGHSLFPRRSSDLVTSCSCPDWSNPCKHVAAVFYLLGEEFDRDPFLILKLRGLEREELPGLLPSEAAAPSPDPEPLACEDFWPTGELPELGLAEPRRGDGMPLIRRLGGFPFWRGQVPLPEALAPFYESAAQRAATLGSDGHSLKD